MYQNRLSNFALTVMASSLLAASTATLADTSVAPAATTTSTTPAAVTTTTVTTTTAVTKPQRQYKGAVVPCPKTKKLEEGFYVGGQIGYNAYRFRISSELSFPPTGTVPLGTISQGNPVMADNGYGGGIFAGYGLYWDNYYYTGAEIFVSDGAASQSQDYISNYSKVFTYVNWGFSFIPGVKYTDNSLLYIRLGYSRQILKGQNTLSVNDPTTSFPASYFASKKQWAGGMSYGVGIETALWRRVSVRTEYNHYGFNTFSDHYANNYGASNNQLMVSLIYHFT